MTVKKCDRCGKTFDVNEYNGERQLITLKYGEIRLQERTDLCADCVKSFKEWLKGEVLRND